MIVEEKESYLFPTCTATRRAGAHNPACTAFKVLAPLKNSIVWPYPNWRFVAATPPVGFKRMRLSKNLSRVIDAGCGKDGARYFSRNSQRWSMPIIKRLEGKYVLVLLASDFEDAEFRDVAGPLMLEGATVTVASNSHDVLNGKWGEVAVIPDRLVHDVDAKNYTALYIPGGRAPSKIRDDPDVQRVVREAYDGGLRIGAVCHGPQVLISAGIVKNKTLTSHPAVRAELEQAGANYTGRPVERDGSITTATDPRAIAEFNTTFIREIACCELFGP